MEMRVITNALQRKPKGQSKMENPATLTISGTQDTGQRQTSKKYKTENKTKR